MGVRSVNNSLQEFLDTFVRSGTDAVNPAPIPTGLTATGGVISDYVSGSFVYRAHIFTSSGPFNVTALAPNLPNNVDYLIVAGGGGGGGGGANGTDSEGGGGGAGALYSTDSTVPAPQRATPYSVSVTDYTITVGGGGAGGSNAVIGANGNLSSALGYTVYGGGGGGCRNAGYPYPNPIPVTNNSGVPGPAVGGPLSGSGGGGGQRDLNPPSNGGSAGPLGNAGGAGGIPALTGGGGGGFGGAGGDATPLSPPSTGGSGGAGFPLSITGITTHYAAGGGGAGQTGGAGGSSIGGNGTPNAVPDSSVVKNAVYSTGSGGGGSNGSGGVGGSGVVVVRYQIGIVQTGTAKATGGSISFYTDPGPGISYTIHTFTSSGTFATAPNWTATNVEYVVVAGGGGGGSRMGGGGGAGGYLTGTTPIGAHPQPVSIQVGAGGYGGVNVTRGIQGTPSSATFPAGSQTAIGGGYGGGGPGLETGGPGGSGGGGGGNNWTASVHPGGPGTAGPPRQGYDGGSGQYQAPNYAAGGGGGAGGIGGNGSTTVAGNGGIGIQLPPTFRNPVSAPGPNGGGLGMPGPNSQGFWVAGGGGGGSLNDPDSSGGGPGGPYSGGGGGKGGNEDGQPGAVNTGGGGGGSADSVPNRGGFGGSGIVLIAYPS